MEVHRPLMLGVVGDSAAGKTTLVRGVVRLLARKGVTPVCLDDYYRYERAERTRRGLTPGDPSATNVPLMFEHLQELAAGGSVRKPVYDHRNGVFRDPELVVATDLVIAYGMLTLIEPGLHKLFDLTMYLDPSEELRRSWQIERDTSSRGYTSGEIEALAPARDRDAARFVHGQRALADLVIRAAPAASGQVSYELLARRTPALASLSLLSEQFARTPLPGLTVIPSVDDVDGRLSDHWLFDGTLPKSTATTLQQALRWADDTPADVDLARIGTIDERSDRWRSEVLAVVQQLIAYLLMARR